MYLIAELLVKYARMKIQCLVVLPITLNLQTTPEDNSVAEIESVQVGEGVSQRSNESDGAGASDTNNVDSLHTLWSETKYGVFFDFFSMSRDYRISGH